jgi:tellurite methyltransferase
LKDHVHENISDPAEFLVDNIELLPPGRALDLATGNGRNAVYLAVKGYQVDAVDISAEAVATAMAAARMAGVTITAQVADLDGGYRIQSNTYDLIICFNYLQRSLVPQIIGGLRQGGMLVYETFIIDQRQFGHPKNPDFLLKHNELLELFRDLRCLRYREGVIGNKAIAGIVAQKTASA